MPRQDKWTEPQREAARQFIGITMPSNPAVLVSNIEEFMPETFRRAFEAAFVALEGGEYTPREMRLIAERDAALQRAEDAERTKEE
jgi:hypothetical protein